jgi:coenzyme Q-binding protein COQ10
MENRWVFKPEDKGTTIEFHIDYQFKSRMLGLLMGAMFETAFKRFSDAFVERAQKIFARQIG